MFKSEEDLKNKIVLPYLQDLGFDVSEVSFEQSFKIRLGTGIHHIDSALNKTKTGRLDILCHKNNKNLFVIEVKNDKEEIKKEDIEQGISYARLLKNNIAPFVLITNGKKTKIVDTITEKILNRKTFSFQSQFWKNDCTLATEEDLNIRYLALKYFIGYSVENLNIFCIKQVESRMSTIYGKDHTSDAKYIDTLYVKRHDLEIAFKKFIDSFFVIFAIIGESGG